MSRAITTDGNQGAIAVWEDARASYSQKDLYMQRILPDGTMKWTASGKLLCDTATMLSSPAIVNDNSGGAFIAWTDNRNPVTDNDIYMQRVDSNGNELWAHNGVLICQDPDLMFGLMMISDGSGGVILSWIDNDDGIMLQRVNPSGTPLWAANGLKVSSRVSTQESQNLAPDGNGGAIVTWKDGFSSFDIYAQRIDGSGNRRWTNPGVPLSTLPGDEWFNCVVASTNGSAIFSWCSQVPSAGYFIFVQKVDSSGNMSFPANGMAITDLTVNGPNYVTSDNNGGCYIAWTDRRNSTTTGLDVYMQHLNQNAMPTWVTHGIPLCNALIHQTASSITHDVNGDAIMIWEDARNGIGGGTDLYGQRISASGTVAWTTNGIPVCTAPTSQSGTSIVAGAPGSAIVMWQDYRTSSVSGMDLYVSKIFPNGSLPLHLLDFSVTKPYDAVELKWHTADEYNVSAFEVEKSYDAFTFNNIGEVKAGDQGRGAYRFTDRDITALSFSNFYYRLKMVDFDGKFSYSLIRKIAQDNAPTTESVMIWPNPGDGQELFFNCAAGLKNIEVTNMAGRRIKDFRIEGQVIRFKSNLPEGVYTIVFCFKDHKEVRPFIKTK